MRACNSVSHRKAAGPAGQACSLRLRMSHASSQTAGRPCARWDGEGLRGGVAPVRSSQKGGGGLVFQSYSFPPPSIGCRGSPVGPV